jgi:hypothetical protein
LHPVAAAPAEPAAVAAALSLTESHAAVVAAPILPCVSGSTFIKPDDLDGHRFKPSRSLFFLGMLFFFSAAAAGVRVGASVFVDAHDEVSARVDVQRDFRPFARAARVFKAHGFRAAAVLRRCGSMVEQRHAPAFLSAFVARSLAIAAALRVQRSVSAFHGIHSDLSMNESFPIAASYAAEKTVFRN